MSDAASSTVPLSTFGAAGNGRDDTAVLERALRTTAAQGAVLEVPASAKPYLVKPLYFPSNSRVLFDKGVVLHAAPHYKPNERMINIEDVSNVDIKGAGAVLEMRKAEFPASEYRHCISVLGSSNVRITGLTCREANGDGIYVSAGKAPYSSNITLEDATFDSCRRQGMTITSAKNVWVRRCHFQNTSGTSPSDGIDIEPNSASDSLENIHIEDSFTDGNKGDGLSFAVGDLRSNSAPVSISVLRHTSARNGRSGYYAGYEIPGVPGVKGTIMVSHSLAVDSGTYGVVANFYTSSGPELIFDNLTVVNANTTRTTFDNAAIAVKRGGGGMGTEGNIQFIHPTIVDPEGFLDSFLSLRDYSHVGFAHIRVVGPTLHSRKNGLPLALVDGKPVNAIEIP